MERGGERRGELGCCRKGVFGEVSGEGGVERGVDGERSVIVCVLFYHFVLSMCGGGKCIICVISVFCVLFPS